MRAALTAALLALILSGCLGVAQVDYGACLDTVYPTPACEGYYEWVPGWWTIGGYWRDGYYRLRPGYHHVFRDHRVIIRRDPRDHRRWR